MLLTRGLRLLGASNSAIWIAACMRAPASVRGSVFACLVVCLFVRLLGLFLCLFACFFYYYFPVLSVGLASSWLQLGKETHIINMFSKPSWVLPLPLC